MTSRPHEAGATSVTPEPFDGQVSVTESGTTYQFSDSLIHVGWDLPPIRRAVIVARLRTLADLIERGDTDAQPQ